MSDDRLRAKTRRTICMALTKKVVTSALIKGGRRYCTDNGDSREKARLLFSERRKINK